MFQSFDETDPRARLFPECAGFTGQDKRYFIVGDESRPRCRVAAFRARSVGMLGLYEADACTPQRDTSRLLTGAASWLRKMGCKIVVGPMNGSTWFDYRLALPGGGDPFLADVTNPVQYVDQWQSAGFSPIEQYVSYAFDAGEFASVSCGFTKRLLARGISVNGIDQDNFDTVLPEIHALANEAFATNPFFYPIDYERFAALYAPAREIVEPRFALVARDPEGGILGFAFAFRDLLDQAHKSLVVKTVATRPVPIARGIGAWLTSLLHRRAADAGFDRIYHALMHEHNISANSFSCKARVHRRYALFGEMS